MTTTIPTQTVHMLLYSALPGKVTDIDAEGDMDALDPLTGDGCGRGASPLTLDDDGAAWCPACRAARRDRDALLTLTT